MMWMPSGLLYTDAPEITGLANLPLGLALGPVYQLINVSLLGCELRMDLQGDARFSLKVPLIEICRMDPRWSKYIAFPIDLCYPPAEVMRISRWGPVTSKMRRWSLTDLALILDCQCVIFGMPSFDRARCNIATKITTFHVTLVDDWRSRSRAILLSLARLLLERSVLSMQPGRRM